MAEQPSLSHPQRDLSGIHEGNPPRLALRPKEAAAALGVSPRTLWTWTDAGEIPHVRRGGTVLYPVDAVRRWLDEQSAISGNGGAQ